MSFLPRLKPRLFGCPASRLLIVPTEPSRLLYPHCTTQTTNSTTVFYITGIFVPTLPCPREKYKRVSCAVLRQQKVSFRTHETSQVPLGWLLRKWVKLWQRGGNTAYVEVIQIVNSDMRYQYFIALRQTARGTFLKNTAAEKLVMEIPVLDIEIGVRINALLFLH